MRTEDLLALADEMAGFTRTPADSGVAHDTGAPVRKALATINATTGDLLLARELGCDTLLLHHPLAGPGRRNFHKVLDRMVELMTEHGVPGGRAEEAVRPLRARSRFNDHASDWDHLVSGARLLGVSLVNAHLSPDEIGRRVMVRALEGVGDDATVAEVMDALRTVPELAHEHNEVIAVPGDPSRAAGRVAVMHAGGTNGGGPVARALFEAGVGTVVYIHLAGADAMALEERSAQGEAGGVVVAGHLASDAIGMNLYLDEVERRGVEVVRHGGLGSFVDRSRSGAPRG